MEDIFLFCLRLRSEENLARCPATAKLLEKFRERRRHFSILSGKARASFSTDTFLHEVWNDTDDIRVVLFMDILRPLPWPVALLNGLIIRIIAASPFIRDAKKNHDEWEKKMAKIWQ